MTPNPLSFRSVGNDAPEYQSLSDEKNAVQVAPRRRGYNHLEGALRMPNSSAPAPANTSTGAELPLLAIPQKRLLTVNESDTPLIKDQCR
jgi:hypothetical protein